VGVGVVVGDFLCGDKMSPRRTGTTSPSHLCGAREFYEIGV
jgi:hypothetical protein